MTQKIEEFLQEKKDNLPSIDTFIWNTEYDLSDNNAVMSEWLEQYIPEDYILIGESIDGTYAEIINEDGHLFACHASGNGGFFSHKIDFELLEQNYKNNLVYKNILDNDDLQALDMLVNEKKMNGAERRHYLIGVDWEHKIARLKNEDLFDSQEIKAIEKLVSEEKLTNAEKRYYILGTNVQEKIEDLKKQQQAKLKVNNVKKVRANNVPDINSLIEGDKLLMEFEEMGVKDHFWCDVKNIEDRFTQSGKRIITVSINDDKRNLDSDKMVEYGLLKEKRALLYDYCRHKHHNLEIGENAYNKRVLEVKTQESLKNNNKKSLKL